MVVFRDNTLFLSSFHKKEGGDILLSNNMPSVSFRLPVQFPACLLTPTRFTVTGLDVVNWLLLFLSSPPTNQPCSVVDIADLFVFSSSFTEERKTNQVSRIMKNLRFYSTCSLTSQLAHFYLLCQVTHGTEGYLNFKFALVPLPLKFHRGSQVGFIQKSRFVSELRNPQSCERSAGQPAQPSPKGRYYLH